MMQSTVAELILQDRKIAYALTNRHLQVIEINGAVDLFYLDHPTWVGESLLALVPELLGCESILADILNGNLPRFELAWINRETSTKDTLYLTMVDLPHQNERGEITGLIHIVDDVTDIGSLEQQLAQRHNELRLLRDQLTRQNQQLEAANIELESLSEMKSLFVSVAAHELRTPLTSIQGYVEVLLDKDFGPLTQNQVKYLEIVQTSAHRLLNIINNLLDVTRIETGQIELVLTPTDLAGLVQKVVAEFAPQINLKSQDITLHSTPNLPLALCDSNRATQIVTNLLINAHKYTPREGQICLELKPAEAPSFLQFSIADNGMGIAPEDQLKLFTRFFRTERARTNQTTGTGLGLYITRSLVELHGGQIWFESKPNQGSTFYVTFPTAGI
ncbi:MAG: HAMP domain-containing histidine kinase [Anaerolineae bacterium]|nr:HAMP domain-containing histidine kinase [Anaerolineae bacterium]